MKITQGEAYKHARFHTVVFVLAADDNGVVYQWAENGSHMKVTTEEFNKRFRKVRFVNA